MAETEQSSTPSGRAVYDGDLPENGRLLWPVDIWFALVKNRNQWIEAGKVFDAEDQREARDAEFRSLIASLKGFPGEKWFSLSEGAGWFSEAVIALSWCEGTEFKDVIKAFSCSDAQLSKDHADYRATRFLNPKFLPQPRLSEIIIGGQHTIQGVQLLLAALGKLPEIDLSTEEVSRLPPDVLNLLIQDDIPSEFLPAHALPTAPAVVVPPPPLPDSPEIKAQRETERRKLLQDAADLIPGRMEERRWSRQQVRETVQSGDKGAVPGHPCGEARRYTDSNTGRALLTDRETGNLLHVGRENYIYLFPFEADVPERIEWPKFRVDDLLSIYVPLRNEWASVWRPVKAQYIHNNVFYILPSQPRPHDERWGFGPDTFVHCEPGRFYEGIFIAAMKKAERLKWG